MTPLKLASVKPFLEAAGLSTVAVLAPIHAVMGTLIALPVIDMVTGILASRKAGQKITSSGMRRTVTKILVYQTAIIGAYFAEKHLLLEAIPACKLLASLIGLTELKSILENLDLILGEPMFKSLVAKLSGKDTQK